MKFEICYPIKPFTITQHFGENLVPIYKTWGLIGHPGIDMVGTMGQIVLATHDGIVSYCGYDENEGQGIVIRTEQQFDYLDSQAFYKSIYWHLLPDSIIVKVGQRVKTGDILAKCDSTGVLLGVKNGPPNVSHLHFGLKPVKQGESDFVWYNWDQSNGYAGAINPDPFFNGLYAADLVRPILESPEVITNLKAQVSILQRIVEILKVLLHLK